MNKVNIGVYLAQGGLFLWIIYALYNIPQTVSLAGLAVLMGWVFAHGSLLIVQIIWGLV